MMDDKFETGILVLFPMPLETDSFALSLFKDRSLFAAILIPLEIEVPVVFQPHIVGKPFRQTIRCTQITPQATCRYTVENILQL